MNNAIDLPVTGFPTLRELFDEFDELLFDSRLKHWSIEWSARMKTSAGLCEPRKRSIRISSIIHQYRSLKELRETILHEMIHAHLYQEGIRRESAHGPSFQKAAKMLGEVCQLNITTYHHFFEEVQEARTSYIWRCASCGFEKHGRTKPSSKKHNGHCTGMLVREVNNQSGTSSPPMAGHIIRPIRDPAKHIPVGKGVLLGRAAEPIIPDTFVEPRVIRETLKMDWVRSFELSEASMLIPLAVSPETKIVSGTERVGKENTPPGRLLLKKEITLQQSMLTKGVLAAPSSNMMNQWDD